MIYSYSQTNRLKEPHAYMYTQFQGEPFLEAYLSSRLDTVNRLAKGNHGCIELDQSLTTLSLQVIEHLFNSNSVEAGGKFILFLASINLKVDYQNEQNADIILDAAKSLTLMTTEESVSTLNLLHALIAAQTLNIQDMNIKDWHDRLVQRFEVTKKLFESYPPGFRKGEGLNTEVRLYWLFALTLSLFFARTQKIKYLSTLLKVCDLLCSLPATMLRGEIPEGGLELVLATEIVSVLVLTEQKGVKLEFK